MCEKMSCRECQYSEKGVCKRLKNNDAFAKPYFKCEYFSNHVICSDFQPRGYLKYFLENEWTNFEEYFKQYIIEWLPYQKTDILIWFTKDDNVDIRYGVPFWDYVYGKHYDGNELKYVAKKYYKKTNKRFGYKLVTEYV